MVTPAQPSRRFLAPGDKLGKYEVIRQIAVGGMAELHLARTVGIEGFEKLVCVKRILPLFSDNPSFVSMFLNEARLAATLHHPNIAQIYDIGQEDGEFFFSMEYVHGEDLGRLVATSRETGVPISLDCVLTLVAGLCAGLHHAHEKASPDGRLLGVVHRDVSPTNVLVSYDGAVKLVDFGIARAGGEQPSWQTGLKGKISYMSPEQCRGQAALDRRSDVFSVGTILYELTTGQLPFTAKSEYAVLQQIVDTDAPRPSTVVPGYSPALEAIVMRALSRDPVRRYATALELQNQIEDYAHDNRLRVSPLVLARLMSTLFPTRLEEWDHARSQGAFFVEQHVVRTLIESGKTADSAPRYLPPGDDTSVRTNPVALPSAAGIDSMEPTELGPEPQMPPAGLSSPPPGALQARPGGTPGAQAHPRLPSTAAGPSPGRTAPVAPGQALPRIPTMQGRPPTAPPGLAQAPGATPQIARPSTNPPAGQAGPRPSTNPPRGQGAGATNPQTLPGQASSMPPPQMAPSATTAPTMAPLATPPGLNVNAGGTRPSGRSAPVSNMPGAVPIVMAVPPPPVPSGGTLVSSATQAGTQPPPVAAGPGRFGAPSIPGYGGAYDGPFGPETPPGGFGFGPAGAKGGYAGHAGPPHSSPHGLAMGQGRGASAGVEDVTDQVVRVSPVPTLIVRHPRKSRLSLAVLAMVGAAGAVVGVWLAIRNDAGAMAPASETSRSAPSASPAEGHESQPAGGAGSAAEEVVRDLPAPGNAAGPAPGGEPGTRAADDVAASQDGVTPSSDAAGAGGANPPSGEAGAQAVVPVDESGDARDPTRKRAGKASQDARVKGAKPKRPNPRPPDTKRAKPDTKEPSWNGDSPFLPETPPRR